MKKLGIAIFILVLTTAIPLYSSQRVPIQIEHPIPGSPITVGIPFPEGALYSPDHVRLLDSNGQEVLSQVTEVTTWAPRDESLKWIWVFFFATQSDEYTLEYGEDVTRTLLPTPRIKVVNNQRTGGFAEVNTGPLRFRIEKGESGGFSKVEDRKSVV